MEKTILLTILVTGLMFNPIENPSQDIKVLLEERIDSEEEEKSINIRGVVVQGDPDYEIGREAVILVEVNPKERRGDYNQSVRDIDNPLERITPGIREGDIIQIYGEIVRYRTDTIPIFVTMRPSDNFYIKKV